jgi:hypothetical protein
MAATLGKSVLAAIASAACLASTAVAQQDLPVVDAAATPEPLDRLTDAAEVSAARIIVGIMVDAGEPPFETARPSGQGDGGDIRDHVPARAFLHPLPRMIARPWQTGTYCARLLSPDALYEGRAEYEVGADASGGDAWFRFKIIGENWEVLTERHRGQLAIAVTHGACDEVPSTEHAIVRWAPADAAERQPETLTIFVNGQGASEVYAEVKQGGARIVEPRPCHRGGESAGVGFDRLCTLPLADLPANGPVTIEVNRLAYGMWEEPVDVTLHLVPPR